MTNFADVPTGWQVVRLGDHVAYLKTISLSRAQLDEGSPIRYLHYGDIHTRASVKLPAGEEPMPRAPGDLIGNAGILEEGDLVFADASEDPDGVGKSVEITSTPDAGLVAGTNTIAARFDKRVLADGFKGYLQFIPAFRDALLRLAAGTKVLATTRSYISSVELALPPVEEQRAIARALGDVDDLVEALQRAIRKKQFARTGLSQQLVGGAARLPGFDGAWNEHEIGDIAVILDNLRVPLSAKQRAGRAGPFPYCGANGVLDHIDDYMVDGDVILLAEDGGNFEQWQSRPIAYRMQGRIWVNNHAHVLKATESGDTGFLFYALERKDITQFISSGTRSKLTRGELVRVKVRMPDSIVEQRAIAEVLGDADAEIEALQLRLDKTLQIREGMMQELLTGRTRLPVAEVAA